MEDLVKKVLEKDDNPNTSEILSTQLFPTYSAISKFKEGFSNRKI